MNGRCVCGLFAGGWVEIHFIASLAAVILNVILLFVALKRP